MAREFERTGEARAVRERAQIRRLNGGAILHGIGEGHAQLHQIRARAGQRQLLVASPRDRALFPPLGLASLAPFLGLLTGAAHWLQPRVSESMSIWWVWGIDIILIISVFWTIFELALKPSRQS